MTHAKISKADTMRRTIRLRLRPLPDQQTLLSDTCRQFTAAFNQAAKLGWDAGVSNATRLHYLVYHPLREANPTLIADLILTARSRAADAISSGLALKRKGLPHACPVSKSCPPRYNAHTYKLNWQSETVRLATTGGRQDVGFCMPSHFRKYAGCRSTTADLIGRDDGWWLYVSVEVPSPKVMRVQDGIGVDLGIAQPAVTSNNAFLGKKSWRDVEARRFKHRRALQAKGTKSARRHLRKTRHKQARFRRDCDHVLAKQIVAVAPPGGFISLENLVNIRKRVKVKRGPQSRRLHSWSFAQIKSFIEYKAEERGVTVVSVDPRHTSQQCPSCGHTSRNNRRSRVQFLCRLCGYELHADLVGARNIAAKYLADLGISEFSGRSAMPPIAGVVDAENANSAETACKPHASACAHVAP